MENSESKKERLAYVARVEDLAEDFLNQLENPEEKQDSNVNDLIDVFIKDVDSEKVTTVEADEKIQELWENLRKKMLNQEMDDQNVSGTTKRYVREFLDDIKPRTTKKREKSSKIKLTEEEQQKLKLFGQL
ncbi:hypothetical protein [Candidatus Uabimicrobium amorphum]|uniref:Uncharacterized protein n=1 Tax=Uabimicrobium amorphum TaxID=2596890 RepID=A0A5S9IJH3_UABAM|nr:hypothetical protein [Candidatus Uabimicrobium amorphum]BBM82522.1 hypothetical protein UABAM_00865 [Candidatus Uabimicrobium amorphum]